MADPALLVVALPLAAALLLALLPRWRWQGWANALAASVTFGLACGLLFEDRAAGAWLLVDPLAIHMVLLTSFVGATTALFNTDAAAKGRLHPALFQALLGCMMLALFADSVALTWLALEAAVIAALAPMVLGGGVLGGVAPGLRRAAMLAGAGLALALVGTVLLTLAGLPAGAARWGVMHAAADGCDGPLLSVAFVFLLLGYGTVAALAPLFGWFTTVHAEAPFPANTMLAGLVVNVAAVVLLRLRWVLDGAHAVPPGGPMMALGLATLLVAAAGLWRRRDPARFVALAGVAQSGVVVFAFGLGGADAVFAGLLQMTLFALIRTAVLQTARGGGRGLASLGMLAVSGAPPFGLFVSQFLLVVATMERAPLAAAPLVLGLALAAGAALSAIRFRLPVRPSLPAPQFLGAWLHMALALVLGLAMPGAVLRWMQGIAAAATQ